MPAFTVSDVRNSRAFFNVVVLGRVRTTCGGPWAELRHCHGGNWRCIKRCCDHVFISRGCLLFFARCVIALVLHKSAVFAFCQKADTTSLTVDFQFHTCAIVGSSGGLWCWGKNDDGQVWKFFVHRQHFAWVSCSEHVLRSLDTAAVKLSRVRQLLFLVWSLEL